MSCSSVVSAAMAACQPCAPRAQSQDLYLVDRITGSRATIGTRVDVDLSTAPEKTLDGRFWHIRGIVLLCTAGYTVGATNGLALARTLRAIWQSIRLTDVTGHVYLPDIDGRDLLDDTFFRHGARVGYPSTQAGDQVIASNFLPPGPDITNDYGFSANAGAGSNVQRSVSLYVPFTSPLDPLSGLIPVSALKRADGGALSFNIRSDIPSSPSNLTLTGVFNALGAAGIDVMLDLVALDGLVDGGAWGVDSYVLQSATGKLRHEDEATEYAYLRFRAAGDNFGGTTDATYGYEAQCADVDIFSVKVAGTPTPLQGFDKRYAAQRGLYHMWSNPQSALARMNAAQDLPMMTSGGVPLTQCILPYRPVGFGEAAGVIDYAFGSIGSLTGLRFLQRIRKCTSKDRLQAFADAAKCQVTSATPVNVRGGLTTNRSPVVMTVAGK